ncbi:MAG: TIGR03067 domain-containing protein [Gemmataceae bacterium]|nr:TIGR03067 domain-containing protein [Gemmataceae bacterium]MCI0737690.1 TIGR03067 domain-containing protein [Gemmataceae bacterium]
MRAHIASILVVGSLVATCRLLTASEDKKGDAVKMEMKQLEGVWVLQSLENDGKPLSEEQLKQIRLTIKGDRYTVEVGDRKVELTYKLDPSKKPKTIDFSLVGDDEKKTTPGIYELATDTFKMCRAAEVGGKRPAEFSAAEGSGRILAVYKREKK